MKYLLGIAFISASALGQSGFITDFNYQVTDIARQGLKKEQLFARMERKIIDLEKSICANRAHLWAYDLHRFWGLNTGKIFIFFSSSVWQNDKKGWMYHVAPYIVENGVEYVMEASYNDVKQPLTVFDWVENESDGKLAGDECLEITAADVDLTKYFYERFNLPEQRNNGKPGARCYIRKVPGHYWFPTSIALHDLKKDAKGRAVDFNPQGFDRDDVLEACTEAASSKLSRFFGSGKEKCKKHLKFK
jgi:hypothetical protein